MQPIDLHTHSTFSDGTLTPTELVHSAKTAGLSALALTDHDTLNGILEGATAAVACDLEFISGIELDAMADGTEVHILGYLFDADNAVLRTSLALMAEQRDRRNTQMCQKLAALNIHVTQDDLLNHTKKNMITRAHFANALIKKGICKTFENAFSKYLSPGCAAYVPRFSFTASEVIALIRQAGGIAVLAHPFLYKFNKHELDTLIGFLAAQGLGGIEAVYATHTPVDEAYLRQLAKKYRLHITGGSDFHGQNKPHIAIGKGRGRLFVPYSLLQDLKEAQHTAPRIHHTL